MYGFDLAGIEPVLDWYAMWLQGGCWQVRWIKWTHMALQSQKVVPFIHSLFEGEHLSPYAWQRTKSAYVLTWNRLFSFFPKSCYELTVQCTGAEAGHRRNTSCRLALDFCVDELDSFLKSGIIFSLTRSLRNRPKPLHGRATGAPLRTQPCECVEQVQAHCDLLCMWGAGGRGGGARGCCTTA